MRKLFILFLIIPLFYFTQGTKSVTAKASSKPKLIVGVVVDQMRNDYIYRYWDRYGSGGFKKLINNGYYLRNAHFNYVPTYTGPGHSSIYTGTTPRYHGIIANEWYNKKTKQMQYCVDDDKVESVGTKSRDGKKSPVNQLSSTIGDELKISSNGKSKVFGIALKDRSAVLPAGHAADAAFWFDDSTGNFVSSTWYLNQLPEWLNKFNSLNLTSTYLSKGWNTLYPITTYTNSIADQNKFEKASNKKDNPVFPYDYVSFINKKSYAVLKATPHGNTITKDLAIACLKGESLGKDEFTDILAISFSSPDIIAHNYGPRSVEIEDVYLRLDKELEELINTLDKEVGANNYVLFLTADHGGADVPAHLNEEQIPAGYLTEKEIVKITTKYFQKTYNDSSLYANYSNDQIFVDEEKLSRMGKDIVEQALCNYLVTVPGILEAYPSNVIKNGGFSKRDIRTLIQNGYNHTLSGNVAFVMNPAWMDYGKKGTTHGASYSYDTHVPIIFYGSSIKKGSSLNYTTITQIVPTLCDIINLNYPNACMDDAIDKAIKKVKK